MAVGAAEIYDARGHARGGYGCSLGCVCKPTTFLGGDRVKLVRFFYGAGVATGAAAGFFCPFWYLGFVPLSAGLVWAAYDLVEADDAESSSTP